jgi:sugar-specific transcriptional regulator TrmB
MDAAVEYLKSVGSATALEISRQTGLPLVKVYEQLVRAEAKRIAGVYISYKLEKPEAIWEYAL